MKLNLAHIEEQQLTSSYEPIAPGWHVADITGNDIKPTKSGNGQYLALELTIGNRRVWDNLNFDNPNPRASEIALSQLKRIATAIGQAPDNVDTDGFLGQQIQVKLGIDAKDPSRNRVLDYKTARTVAAPAAPRTVQPAAPAASPAVGGKPAWMK
jgi:hypothetical protein